MYSENEVSEAALSSQLKHSGGVGFWQWDIKADIAQADAVSALLFNLSPAQSKGGVPLSTVMEAIHPDDSGKLSSLILDRVRTGGSYAAEYRVVSPVGKVRWLFTRGHFYLDKDNCPSHGRGVIVDITDTKTNGLAYVDYDVAATNSINRAADHCLSLHYEVSKIGNTKMLTMIELILLELGVMIADDYTNKTSRGLH